MGGLKSQNFVPILWLSCLWSRQEYAVVLHRPKRFVEPKMQSYPRTNASETTPFLEGLHKVPPATDLLRCAVSATLTWPQSTAIDSNVAFDQIECWTTFYSRTAQSAAKKPNWKSDVPKNRLDVSTSPVLCILTTVNAYDRALRGTLRTAPNLMGGNGLE